MSDNRTSLSTEEALQERIKEMRVIYSLSDLAQDLEITLQRFLQQATEILPSGLKYSNDAYAAISFENRAFTAGAYRDTPWQLRSAILVRGNEVGAVVVGYRSFHEDIFLAEERTLVDEVARRIGLLAERIQAQEALRRSEARNRGLFENSPIALFEQDFSAVKHRMDALRSRGVTDFRALFETRPDLVSECVALVKFLDFNKAALNLYGATDQAQLQVSLESLVPAQARDLFIDELVWIAQGRTSFTWEGVNCKLNGDLVDIRLHWAVEPGYEEHLDRVLVSIEDITARRRAERLAAMGQVTAILAHEIQNPLQAIQSNLELLSTFPLEPDEQDECLRICQDEVRRLREMTRNVLSMARVQTQAYQPVSISETWGKTEELLSRQLQAANVGVDANLPEELPAVLGSPEQLAQVMINLTLNSIDSMPNGGALRIAGERSGDRLIVTFANNGPPIPANHLPRLFEPFFTTKPGGSGLGLFVSHMIIQQHGAELSVANLPDGKGVSFTMALLIAPPPHSEAVGAAQPGEP